MPNIEIKARYPEPDKARSIAQTLGAIYVGIDHQIDTYFFTRSGRLKLRESSRNGAELVPYHRPDQAGPKKSDYMTIPVNDPSHCKRLLELALGVEIVIEKSRDFYLFENVRIYVDDVKNLGKFFEFEAVYDDGLAGQEKIAYEKVKHLMQVFEITERSLERGSYRELMIQLAR